MKNRIAKTSFKKKSGKCRIATDAFTTWQAVQFFLFRDDNVLFLGGKKDRLKDREKLPVKIVKRVKSNIDYEIDK